MCGDCVFLVEFGLPGAEIQLLAAGDSKGGSLLLMVGQSANKVLSLLCFMPKCVLNISAPSIRYFWRNPKKKIKPKIFFTPGKFYFSDNSGTAGQIELKFQNTLDSCTTDL